MKHADTKTLILDVAQDLIQRLGANGMSYQDISDRVGIRKASVHSHFPKKDDLLAALLDRYSDRFFQMLDGILASNDSPEVKLRRYCGLYETTLNSGNQDKVCLCAMLGAELAALNSPSAAKVCAFYQGNEARLAQILTAGLQTGEFRFTGDVQATAMLILSFLEGGMLVVRAQCGASQFHGVIDQLIRLVKG